MKIEKFLNMLGSDIPLAYDVETTGLQWQTKVTIGYSISDGRDAHYIPVRHSGGGNIDYPESFEHEIEKAIRRRTTPLYTHNGKFDSHFSLNHGIDLGNNIEDTMIAAALINEYAKSYSLEYQCAKYKDIPQKKSAHLYNYLSSRFGGAASSRSMANFHQLSGDDGVAVEYAEGDTLSTYHLRKKQEKDLYGQNLERIYGIENKLLHVLRKMERRGIKVDPVELEKVKTQVEELQLEAYGQIPLKEDMTPYNFRSSKDLQEYFEMHDITDWEFTAPTDRFPTGQPSFGKGFLGQHEPGKILLQARALDHFNNSFIKPIDNYIYDNVLYTNFNQTQGEFGFGTKTGRLSSTKPNMQQVPKRDKVLGAILRSIFVARPGYTFVEFDYSQAEPRLFSHYSDEPALIEGYNSNPPVDMHAVTGKLMHITRDRAKSLNLGLQYTMGVKKLSKQLGISEGEARDMYNTWKRMFPNVADFTKLAENVAKQRGYVKTILGRRAHFDDDRFCYRAANRIVQGGSADILKYKMVELDDHLVKTCQEDEIRMLLNIHDAILFEIKDEILEKAIKEICHILETVQCNPFNLKVPFVADWKKGKTWKEATYD